MKKFFLSITVVAAFVLYSFIRQNTQTPQPTSPITDVIPSGTPEPSPTPQPLAGTSLPPAPTTAAQRGQYTDGTFTGDAFDAFYGNIQVEAVISGGKLTDVRFLQYPSDRRTSMMINTQAMPMLRQEAIQAQSANVDIISGASDSSSAFIQSLGSALQKAKV